MQKLSEQERQEIAQSRIDALRVADEVFEKLDLNGDGMIEKHEVRHLCDNNHPGMLAAQSQSESNGPGAGQESRIRDFFAAFDINGDGCVSREEWLDFFGKLYDSVIAKGLTELD